jgi:hypothetical protein
LKRYYLISESSWESQVRFHYRSGPLGAAFEGKGCCWLDLASGYRLVSGEFAAEDREDAWNSHPAVVHLHHPVKESTLSLGDLFKPEHAYKRFRPEHMELLKHGVNASESDTMSSLNTKVAVVHRGCIIYPIPAKTALWLY